MDVYSDVAPGFYCLGVGQLMTPNKGLRLAAAPALLPSASDSDRGLGTE
jgi:hypothetical protein